MHLEFTETAWNDFEYWLEKDPLIVKKIKELIKSILRTPFEGKGNPEPLRHDYKGCWSRRINSEHRLVYKITEESGENQKCIILQCRFHYDK